ncbi:hypothetical protein R1sor_000160 [Riccia sorocarpa]|uniref:Reverse transcriptase domain-containing protein n=1 Tax=Riccia sorocarpa TaxID=122646 RepID=A0ABD3GSI9_9MARC
MKESEIKVEATEYFRRQFPCPAAAPEDLHIREEVLKLVDRQVSEEKNEVLARIPGEKEIDELVAELPRDKALGLDGVRNGRKNQEALFLKLDFAKAYDRVRHDFIWDTLRAMNIHPHFIKLLQGLVHNGTSKVHANGLFTEEVDLQRGVRQGYPVAPYLFVTTADSTIGKKEKKEGRVEGVMLPEGKQLLHQLFADDTGIHMQAKKQTFIVVQDLVHTFERISGASLNASKSIIIPLGLSMTPTWMERTGCKIASTGEMVLYLGGPIGNKVSDADIVDFLLAKFQKQLFHWST